MFRVVRFFNMAEEIIDGLTVVEMICHGHATLYEAMLCHDHPAMQECREYGKNLALKDGIKTRFFIAKIVTEEIEQ